MSNAATVLLWGVLPPQCPYCFRGDLKRNAKMKMM